MLRKIFGMYEYRVPRSRFSGDRLDNQTDNLLYSDKTANNRAGSNVLDETTVNLLQTQVWNLEFIKLPCTRLNSHGMVLLVLYSCYVPVGESGTDGCVYTI